MSEDPVVVAIDDHIATIRLNRPENRNSMTQDLLRGVSTAARSIQEDRDVRCVVVTGSGSTFCGGADFKANDRGDEALPAHERTFSIYSHFLSILDIPVPVVAALNGHAIGGGLGLALVCDIRVANAEAKYGANFVRLGLHPGMASTYLLPRLMGLPRATELLLTGRIISGAEAAELGLVNHAVSPDAVLGKAREIAGEIAAAAPLAVRWTKRSLYESQDWGPISAARREALVQSLTMESEDFKEGVRALLEKRPPDFRGR